MAEVDCAINCGGVKLAPSESYRCIFELGLDVPMPTFPEKSISILESELVWNEIPPNIEPVFSNRMRVTSLLKPIVIPFALLNLR